MSDQDDTTEEDSQSDEAARPLERTTSLAELAAVLRRRRGESSEDVAPPEDSDIDLSDLDIPVGTDPDELDLTVGSEAGPDDSSYETRFDEIRAALRGEGSSSGSDTVEEAFSRSPNVLLLAPLQSRTTDHRCIDLLVPNRDPAPAVLFVTVTRPAESCIDSWREFSTTDPVEFRVLTLGDTSRRGTRSTTVSLPDTSADVTLESLSDPSDLTRLGVTLGRNLTDMSDKGATVTVCIHSLTALLQYVSPDRLFRFLHILQQKVASLDVRAHYHLDPAAHEEQTVTVFRSLFDTVVLVTESGDLELQSNR